MTFFATVRDRGFRGGFLLASLIVGLSLSVDVRAQGFSPSRFAAGSKTGGIQEAIDQAAKAGGGVVTIPSGTFVLQPAAGQPGLLLRSNVRLVGAGMDSTVLRLGPKARGVPAVIANASFANPNAGPADHDVAISDLTIDGSAAEQVVATTRLSGRVSKGGAQEVALESMNGLGSSLLLVGSGADSEFVAPGRISPVGLTAIFLRPHAPGSPVLVLIGRLHGLALGGCERVSMQRVRIQNTCMDGVYLANYCHQVSVSQCEFLACHRNGISIIDADDVEIRDNTFRDIAGAPGAAVDIEPNHPEEHGNRIEIRDNLVQDCYRGLLISLQNGGPDSANFQQERLVGNTIRGALVDWGIQVLGQRANTTVSTNSIMDPALYGIDIESSSNITMQGNQIVNPGRCHTPGVCYDTPSGVGIRLAAIRIGPANPLPESNTITGNVIQDNQHEPTLLYGIDFAGPARGNKVVNNIVSRFSSARGAAVHAPENVAKANSISGNQTQ